MLKRMFVAAATLALTAPVALAQNGPGVTDKEIKIGQTMPHAEADFHHKGFATRKLRAQIQWLRAQLQAATGPQLGESATLGRSETALAPDEAAHRWPG